MDFPAVRPTSRSYKPGKFPQIQFEALNGATTTIRYGEKAYNAELNLTFANISDDDAYLIINNYEQSMRIFDNIIFRSTNGLAGIDSLLSSKVSETSSGLKWRYAEPPQVQSVYPGVSTVTCRFTGFLDGA
nr:hypothetical protein 13 [bacterium]